MRDRIAGRVARTAQRILDEAQRRKVPLAEVASVRVPWMSIRAAMETAGSPSTAEVLIYEEIGGSAGVSAEDFARQIAEIKADVIKVRINSPGGSLFDGLAIYNALNHHPARIDVYVDSLAASVASVIAMAGDRVVMMPGSQLMIHDAGMVTDGNAGDMAKAATFLGRQSDNIAGIYATRAGGDAAAWRERMLAETWMFADEAVELGLADHAETGPVPQRAEAGPAATRSFDLSRFGYRYEGRDRAPAPVVATRSRARVSVRDREPAVVDVSREAAPGMAERSVPFELEPSSDGLTLVGYAAVYNSPARIEDRHGAFDEVILPGAFDDALRAHTPVLMFEHGRHPLIGTMPLGVITRLDSDSTGLRIEARLSDNWLIQPVRDAVRDGGVKGMSFRFDASGGDRWQARAGDVDLRTIHTLRAVPELGPVVFPAYEPTTATIRSLAERLPDLTGRSTRGVGGGDPDRPPGNGAPSSIPTSTRFTGDGESLRLRGILK